jgi:hypothetical protein
MSAPLSLSEVLSRSVEYHPDRVPVPLSPEMQLHMNRTGLTLGATLVGSGLLIPLALAGVTMGPSLGLWLLVNGGALATWVWLRQGTQAFTSASRDQVTTMETLHYLGQLARVMAIGVGVLAVVVAVLVLAAGLIFGLLGVVLFFVFLSALGGGR